MLPAASIQASARAPNVPAGLPQLVPSLKLCSDCALYMSSSSASALQEFPTIRFRAAKPGEDASTGLEARSLVAQRVAVDLNERLSAMQRSGQLPTGSTCDLVIFDRFCLNP